MMLRPPLQSWFVWTCLWRMFWKWVHKWRMEVPLEIPSHCFPSFGWIWLPQKCSRVWASSEKISSTSVGTREGTRLAGVRVEIRCISLFFSPDLVLPHPKAVWSLNARDFWESLWRILFSQLLLDLVVLFLFVICFQPACVLMLLFLLTFSLSLRFCLKETKLFLCCMNDIWGCSSQCVWYAICIFKSERHFKSNI